MSAEGRRLKILLTEGSSTSARQTLYALGGRHTIDLLDPSPFCQCRFSRFVRRWHRCPSYSKHPQEFLRFLAERLRAEEYDVVFPTHEHVFLLARVRDELSQHVGTALPSFEAIQQVQGKADFNRLLTQLDLPYPETAFVHTRQQLQQHGDFPCFVKLSHSTAGRGVFRAEDAGELTDIAARLDESGVLDGDSEVLIQQPATGILSVFQTVFQRGKLVAWHGAESRVLGAGGAPMARVSKLHAGIQDEVARLGAHLDWHGALFVEYFYDPETGQRQFLEANPRIGETLNATLCGVNLCEQWLRVALDETIESTADQREGVRTHQGFMMLMTHAMKGGGRLELGGEIMRAFRGADMYRDSQDELTRWRHDWLSLIPATTVTLQLLAAPRTATSLVNRTVGNYSLPESAAMAIQNMPVDELTNCLGVSST